MVIYVRFWMQNFGMEKNKEKNYQYNDFHNSKILEKLTKTREDNLLTINLAN